ncbi:MAG: DUF5063 domain-containing protein [Bacteroidaceae bacterium]|nr:DUF5063 domain-containing protein [Bacteroidaceae bacterium]
MNATEHKKTIYGRDVLEFVTVAIEYCAFLEKSQGRPKSDFTGTMLKLLPLLYVKAQLLPKVETDGTFLPNGKVTEDDYNYILRTVYDIMGNADQYLDVSYEDEMETDETQWKSVSEHLADIYQSVRNFLAVYQDGVEECMADALWAVQESFETYWGTAVVDALKRLHKIHYSASSDEEDDTTPYYD